MRRALCGWYFFHAEISEELCLPSEPELFWDIDIYNIYICLYIGIYNILYKYRYRYIDINEFSFWTIKSCYRSYPSQNYLDKTQLQVLMHRLIKWCVSLYQSNSKIWQIFYLLAISKYALMTYNLLNLLVQNVAFISIISYQESSSASIPYLRMPGESQHGACFISLSQLSQLWDKC